MAIRLYPAPPGAAVSRAFAVSVNGQAAPVRVARVSAVPFNCRWPGHQRPFSQSEPAWFVGFAMDEPAALRVTAPAPFREAVIKPLSRRIVPQADGRTLAFTLPRPGGYTVELDGCHGALHLFADPVKDYAVDSADPRTRVFGPGVHRPGILQLRSGDTVYLDEGAVVHGCLHADRAENIRILGRGVLDSSCNTEEILFDAGRSAAGDARNSRREHTIKLTRCRNVEIDGPTIRDSLVYNIAAWGCEDVRVDTVKIIGSWRYNTDGIDLHNCRRCVVRNCFVRTFDDSICAKGHLGYPPLCEDIRVEGCVLWGDWGNVLEIGAETCASELRRITFRDCDIIRCHGVAMDVLNSDYGDVHDVRYEDIRVEADADAQRPRSQTADGEAYPADPRGDYRPWLISLAIVQHAEYSGGRPERGKIRDIAYRNIQVFSDRMLPARLVGYDRDHRIGPVRIDGLFWNGQPVRALDALPLSWNEFADPPRLG